MGTTDTRSQIVTKSNNQRTIFWSYFVDRDSRELPQDPPGRRYEWCRQRQGHQKVSNVRNYNQLKLGLFFNGAHLLVPWMILNNTTSFCLGIVRLPTSCLGVARCRPTFLSDIKSVFKMYENKSTFSGPNDHVFVNFVDHGAPGIIAFPEGEVRL